jgi:cyanophycinase
MNLYLHGGASYDNMFDFSLLDQVLKLSGSEKLLYVVLAINEAEIQKRMLDGFGRFSADFGLQARILSVHNIDQARELIMWADTIFFNGGSQGRLIKSLTDNNLVEPILQNVAAGRYRLVGGESAGAMIMGQLVIVGRHEVKSTLKGLDLMKSAVVDSHFTNRDRLPRLIEQVDAYPGLYGVGVDEGCGLLIDADGQKTLNGIGSVTYYSGGKVEVYDQV